MKHGQVIPWHSVETCQVCGITLDCSNVESDSNLESVSKDGFIEIFACDAPGCSGRAERKRRFHLEPGKPLPDGVEKDVGVTW